MKRTKLALSAMIGLGSMMLTVQASELPNAPHLVTSGRASVDATPDIAIMAIEVKVSAKDAVEAKNQADQRVQQYFDFLKQNGIEKKDINAANLRTQPEYDYPKDGKPQLKGYSALRQVQVTLHQLDKLNSLLDGALKSGLNEIRDVEFSVAHPEQYQEKARKDAIDDAVKQANSLAQGFGTKLGPVYSIRYQVANYRPTPMLRMSGIAIPAAASTAAETYQQQNIHFDDQVDVVFELQRNP